MDPYLWNSNSANFVSCLFSGKKCLFWKYFKLFLWVKLLSIREFFRCIKVIVIAGKNSFKCGFLEVSILMEKLYLMIKIIDCRLRKLTKRGKLYRHWNGKKIRERKFRKISLFCLKKHEFFQNSKKSVFWPTFLRCRQILKNWPKGVFRHFLESFYQKNRVLSPRAPSLKLVYIGTEGAFRKNLESVSQNWNWLSQNSSKEGPFGSAGGNSLG